MWGLSFKVRIWEPEGKVMGYISRRGYYWEGSDDSLYRMYMKKRCFAKNQ